MCRGREGIEDAIDLRRTRAASQGERSRDGKCSQHTHLLRLSREAKRAQVDPQSRDEARSAKVIDVGGDVRPALCIVFGIFTRPQELADGYRVKASPTAERPQNCSNRSSRCRVV